ncbi:MAG: hypothetical protein ACLSIB_02280 [Parabacteroides merdae]
MRKTNRGIVWRIVFSKFTVTSCTAIAATRRKLRGVARVWVARPDLFMVYMGAMMRAGIIEDCSFARMAGHVDRIFDTGNTENTVLNKLKEQLPEADSIVDGMKAEFKNFKSRNKK